MSEPEEDFAAMFEASIKAKRYETGQTIEGRIVAIGREVAFIDVGGKGEAEIEIEAAERPDDAVAPGEAARFDQRRLRQVHRCGGPDRRDRTA